MTLGDLLKLKWQYKCMDAIEFFNKNKSLSCILPEKPDSVISDYEIADWLLNKSDFGWLELDIEIDIDTWKQESKVAKFVDHRGKDHPGWNSCCIHGISEEKTGSWTNYGYSNEADVPYHWTSLSEHTPCIKNFWKSFPYERYRRIRFMELEPGGIISPHSDMPGKLPGEDNFNALEFGVPINVAIIHPESCFMTLEGYGCIPWREGKAFLINIRNYHSVINFSKVSRIHLIAHGIPGSRLNEFVKLISNSYKKSYERNKIQKL
jgi:hypothetical protein